MSFATNTYNYIAETFSYAQENISKHYEKLDPTTQKILSFVPEVITCIGCYFASLPTIVISAIVVTLGFHMLKPEVAHIAVGKMAVGIGACHALVKIIIPFSKIILSAAVAGSIMYAGYQMQQADSKKNP